MIIKCFGIAKDITGDKEILVGDLELRSVRDLRKYLLEKYPSFKSFSDYMVAVNQEYASDDLTISDTDIIAIIPPVSGG